MFLTRRLAMWKHLEIEQLPKEGLRYWFTNEHVTRPRGRQRDRRLPPQRGAVLPAPPRRPRRAPPRHRGRRGRGAAAGRRACGTSELGDFDHRVTIERAADVAETVACRWVLDATGRATFLGQAAGIYRPERASIPPRRCGAAGRTCATSTTSPRAGRVAFARRGPRLAPPQHQPLHGPRLLDLGDPARQRRDEHRRRVRHAALIGLPRTGARCATSPSSSAAIPLSPSCWTAPSRAPTICASTRYLPYVTRQYMGPGWALLGDAAAFLDPYYSPGLDHAAFTVEATIEIMKADRAGEDAATRASPSTTRSSCARTTASSRRCTGQVLLHGRAGSPRRRRS